MNEHLPLISEKLAVKVLIVAHFSLWEWIFILKIIFTDKFLASKREAFHIPLVSGETVCERIVSSSDRSTNEYCYLLPAYNGLDVVYGMSSHATKNCSESSQGVSRQWK